MEIESAEHRQFEVVDEEIIKLGRSVGHRVDIGGKAGTIRYVGPLRHSISECDPAYENKDGVWVGIEWDAAIKGGHNGTVGGVCYFTTLDDLPNGSLLFADETIFDFGQNIYDALLNKYIKNNVSTSPQETNGNHNQKIPPKAEKGNGDMKIEPSDVKGPSMTHVEYDPEAYVETLKKVKKMIAFVGFEKIWNKMSKLNDMTELSLHELMICDVGPENMLGKLTPNVETLALEDNLLYDWNQVFLLGHELRNLVSLALSRNNLGRSPVVLDQQHILVNSTGALLYKSPVGIFPNLRIAILIEMRLTWNDVCNLLPAMPQVEELCLVKNNLTDYHNINLPGPFVQNLKAINLEENGIKDFKGLEGLSSLPCLERLILSKNTIKTLGGPVKGFESLQSISLEDNGIDDCWILHELGTFSKLNTLRVGNNPICETHGRSYVRQRAVAEIKGLKTINGSDLKRFDRKDCEIFYLRKTFEEYFLMTNTVYYNYDFDHFLGYIREKHPRVEELLKVYGNPYEISKEPQVQTGKFIKVKLFAAGGPFIGKDPLVKKFPDNTIILNLKTILAKLFSLDQNRIFLTYRNNPQDFFVNLDEDMKSLAFYGVKETSEIWANAN